MSSNKDLLLAASRNILTAIPAPKQRASERLTTSGLWSKPFHSEALGVGPDQVESAREEMRRQGVPIDFDDQGRAIITSDKQYRKAAKACGMWNGQHGYEGGANGSKSYLTGRAIEQKKQEFRKAIARGDFD